MSQSTIPPSNPFWIDEKHEFISSFPIHADLATNNNEYDIVIIGTGLSGIACAYWFT